MSKIGVECRFDQEGSVRVRRIQADEVWLPVVQGRQWIDDRGRHVLVMLPEERVEELLLSNADLTWQLVSRPKRAIV